MADSQDTLEQQVENIIRASFAQAGTAEPAASEETETGDKHVIDVDLYRMEGGAVLLVPNTGQNPLDTNAVESTTAPDSENETILSSTPSALDPQDEIPDEQEGLPVTKGVRRSFVFVPLVLLALLVVGGGSYLFVFPLTATATITLVPEAQRVHADTMLLITTNPQQGQVQGRLLPPVSLTQSETVPATGHGHDDATRASGVITLYNADVQSYTVPAGTSFIIGGVTVVTDQTVTVQAVVPPMLGMASTTAHVIQMGSVGNIAAHALDTRCCGSPFLTATNTSAFSRGQDARDYRFIQPGDITHAASTLLALLTPQATGALQHSVQSGEQLVTPLCTPHTSSSQNAGSEGTSVTVTVTQTCRSVAYGTDSLTHVATTVLMHNAHLTTYQEVGTVEVTVNGSVYQEHSVQLNVSIAGVWVYHLTSAELAQLTHQIAGESQEKATAMLERVAGIAQVSIHLHRLDFKDVLPTDPQHIAVQLFYMVS